MLLYFLNIADFYNLELQHLRVRTHLRQEPQSLHDAIVEINEISFGQIIDVNGHAQEGVDEGNHVSPRLLRAPGNGGNVRDIGRKLDHQRP